MSSGSTAGRPQSRLSAPVAFNFGRSRRLRGGRLPREELKIVNETARSRRRRSLSATAGACRRFRPQRVCEHRDGRKLTAAKARELLKKAPGCKLLSTGQGGLPMRSMRQDRTTLVGRILEDAIGQNGLTLGGGENGRKGAATNAVQSRRLVRNI